MSNNAINVHDKQPLFLDIALLLRILDYPFPLYIIFAGMCLTIQILEFNRALVFQRIRRRIIDASDNPMESEENIYPRHFRSSKRTA